MLGRTVSLSFAVVCVTAIAIMPAHAQPAGTYGPAPGYNTPQGSAAYGSAPGYNAPQRLRPSNPIKAMWHNRHRRGEM